MEEKNESTDLEKLAAGNIDVFHSFFLKYYPKVQKFILFFVKSEAVAEDLSQDIFLHIWNNRDSLLAIQSLDSYMYRMAKNKAINYLSHKKVEEDYALSQQFVQEYSIDEEIDAKELEFLIQLTIERMPEQRRCIFIMSRVEHMKNAEIADKLNLSIKTVEMHITLALKQIREIVSLVLLFFI